MAGLFFPQLRHVNFPPFTQKGRPVLFLACLNIFCAERCNMYRDLTYCLGVTLNLLLWIIQQIKVNLEYRKIYT